MKAFNKMRRVKHTTKSKILYNIFWGSLSSKRTSFPFTLNRKRTFKSYCCIIEICCFSVGTEEKLNRRD